MKTGGKKSRFREVIRIEKETNKIKKGRRN